MSSTYNDITTCISFCTNDSRYLKRCLEEVRVFSSQIIVTVCDHFFNGEKEDYPLLHQLYQEYSDCEWIEYPYLHNELYNPYVCSSPESVNWKMYWHATSRYIAYFFIKHPYTLFLDVDEIVEGEKFHSWLKSKAYTNYNAIRLQNYYYFREAHFRATQHHNNTLIARTKALSPERIFNPDDRFGIFLKIPEPKWENVSGLDGKPMIHHYSGVKTKNEWLKKGKTVGHDWEKDWASLIEEEYARGFMGKDFTFGHNYEIVSPYFDPLAVSLKNETYPPFISHVRRVTKEEIRRLEIKRSYL